MNGAREENRPEPARSENPYESGQRKERDRYMDSAKRIARLEHRNVVLMVLLGIETIGMTVMALQSEHVPYVVEVDKLGRVGAVAPLEPGFREPERRVMVQQLTDFVVNVRGVYVDPITLDRMSRRARAYVTPEGARFLDAYFAREETNPVVLSRRLTRVVEVNSVLKEEGDVWTIEWTETDLPLGVGAPMIAAWRGKFRVEVRPPGGDQINLANPLGILVSAIDWNRISEPRAVRDLTPLRREAGPGATGAVADSNYVYR